jgi:hypothetical protein
MSLQLQKLSISSDILFFRPINPFNFICLLTAKALEAIRNIGSLFSENSTFSQMQEEEIQRVKAALLPSPEEIQRDAILLNNTKLNKNIPFADTKEHKNLFVFRMTTRNVSFNPIEVRWVFRKENRVSLNPLEALRECKMPKPILKQHFSSCDVD